jgi:hypothetical protein
VYNLVVLVIATVNVYVIAFEVVLFFAVTMVGGATVLDVVTQAPDVQPVPCDMNNTKPTAAIITRMTAAAATVVIPTVGLSREIAQMPVAAVVDKSISPDGDDSHAFINTYCWIGEI